MKEKIYFRCSRRQPYEKEKIGKIQRELFAQMENTVGAICGKTDIVGINLDFNVGLRLDIPAGNFHVCIGDFVGGQIFFEDDICDVQLISLEKYAIFWQIDIWQEGRHIFSHTFNPAGQNVIFHCSSRALGDTLAFLPYARLYRDKFQANVFCWVDEYLQEFVAFLYPDIPQVTSVDNAYATYYLGTWTDGPYGSPVNGRFYPLPQVAGAITGVQDIAKSVTRKITCRRIVQEPYICIGVQASTPRKGWHYPNGWNIVLQEIKKAGYRVFCIDRHKLTREGRYEIVCPIEAEDLTGDFTLMERAALLAHAKCFIGLGSGLAWLANAVECPVVMINGFSEDYYEFPTSYRVINRKVCHGCYNDPQVNFMDDTICPHYHDTARELECSKEITPTMVINAVWQAVDRQNVLIK